MRLTVTLGWLVWTRLPPLAMLWSLLWRLGSLWLIIQNVVSKGCRNKSMGYPMVKPHDPIVMSFDSVLKFQGTKVLHIEFSLHEAKSLELKVGVPTPCVVRGAPTRITWFRSVRWCLAVGLACGDQRRLMGSGSALEVVLHDYALYKSTFTLLYFTTPRSLAVFSNTTFCTATLSSRSPRICLFIAVCRLVRQFCHKHSQTHLMLSTTCKIL